MSQAQESQTPESLKILLADDTPMNVALATKLLIRRGHQVTSVENGLQAFETYQKEKFDVILMDVQMPIMDGIEATQKIRETESQESGPRGRIPIIALTANDGEADRKRYLESGMDGVITKPLDIKTMVQTMREIIQKSLEAK